MWAVWKIYDDWMTAMLILISITLKMLARYIWNNNRIMRHENITTSNSTTSGYGFSGFVLHN